MSNEMVRTLKVTSVIYFEVPVSYEPTGKELLFISPTTSAIGVLSAERNRIAARPLEQNTVEVVEVDNDEVIR